MRIEKRQGPASRSPRVAHRAQLVTSHAGEPHATVIRRAAAPARENTVFGSDGARMGTDVRTSVVDASCRVHGINPLFIASSSVFPTSSQANPTLTIVAMALRLARHVAALEGSSRTTVRIERARSAPSRVGT